MEVINHRVEITHQQQDPCWDVEYAARTCYQSERKEGDKSPEFVRRLIRHGHEAMLEFAEITFKITTDRGVSHELVRHRIASYAQESTRYCDYQKCDMQFIKPVDLPEDSFSYELWRTTMEDAEFRYKKMRALKCSPQIARSILPHSLKTEIVVKMNMRAFRNFLRLRTAENAHPDMRHVANLCVDALRGTQYWVFIEDLLV